MTTGYKLPVFDSNYDGYFSIAINIVNVHKASGNFTIDDYNGKDKYFNDHFLKFDEMVSLINMDKITMQDVDNINNMRKCLVSFGGTCKPSYFLLIYLQLMIIASKYDKELILYQAEGLFKEFLSFTNLNIRKSLIDFNNNYPNLVPFISPNAYYGVNTFLFLFFNNIFPIGISKNPISTHADRYRLPLDVSMHDVHHYYYYYRFFSNKLLRGYDEILDHIRENRFFSSDYIKRTRSYYDYTIHGDYHIDRKKFRLICLFNLIHERGEQFSGTSLYKETFNEEELQLIYKIPSYSPLHLGYSEIEDKLIAKHIYSADYIEYDMPEIVKRYLSDISIIFRNEMTEI